MLIDWIPEFDVWLDRLEEAADTDDIAQRRLDYITAQLQVLQALDGIPECDSAVLRRVRQSQRNPVWRLSHPFDPDVAMWFPDSQQAVIALFAADKARMGAEERGRPMKPQDKGGARLSKLLADPARAERVAAVREGMREMDRAYTMNLALIRTAAQLTQTELAARLGVGQAAVSKLERKSDLLLSTLASYLHAANAQARIVVNVGGQDIEYAL